MVMINFLLNFYLWFGSAAWFYGLGLWLGFSFCSWQPWNAGRHGSAVEFYHVTHPEIMLTWS